MTYFERATRELLDKPRREHKGRPAPSLPRLKCLECPMPPDVEAKPPAGAGRAKRPSLPRKRLTRP